jgi:drug/metabolite transporter (DMT)-like permease
MESPLKGIGLIVLSTVCFSGSDSLSKYLVQTLPAGEVAWIRYVIFVAMALLLVVRDGPGSVRAYRPGLQVLRGLGLVGSAVATMLALRSMPLAESTVLGFTTPALITILSIPILGEVVGWRRWAAVAGGLLGVLVVARPGAAAFQVAALGNLVSSLCWALGCVLSRKITATDRASTTLLWTAVVGLLVLTASLPFAVVWPSAAELALALLLGLVAGAGQWCVVLAYRHAAASLLAPLAYLQLIWSSAIGWLFFAAWPDGWTWVGAAIITASGLYTAGRERVRHSPRVSRA